MEVEIIATATMAKTVLQPYGEPYQVRRNWRGDTKRGSILAMTAKPAVGWQLWKIAPRCDPDLKMCDRDREGCCAADYEQCAMQDFPDDVSWKRSSRAEGEGQIGCSAERKSDGAPNKTVMT